MIPKILWQGWIGPKPPPDDIRRYCEDMERMNADDFEYHFFGNEIMDTHGKDPYVRYMVERGEKWAFVMDRLRILVLRDNGGIWIDPDAKPVRPLKVLDVWKDDRWDFLTAHRSPYRDKVQVKRGIAVVDNSVMGSAKNGRVINELARLSTSKNPIVKGSDCGHWLMHTGGGDIFWEAADVFYSVVPSPKAVLYHDDRNLASWCSTKPLQFAKV